MIRKGLMLMLLMGLTLGGLQAQTGDDAARLVQKQLDAYNARDIDAFVSVYSDSVKVYNFPNALQYTGNATMRSRYGGFFARTPDLHCTLVNRMVLGNVVIDQESVIFNKNNPPSKVIAMYKIANGKISEVYFIRPDQQ